MNLPAIPSEEVEQIDFVEWLELVGLPFSAIPNSTYTTSWKQKAKNTRTGLRPGLPDIVVAIPNVGLLFIEMKKRKGGVVSEHQKRWIQILNTVPGVEARVCYGSDEAISFVSELIPKDHHITQVEDFEIF